MGNEVGENPEKSATRLAKRGKANHFPGLTGFIGRLLAHPVSFPIVQSASLVGQNK
jgi:hypothetical protein